MLGQNEIYHGLKKLSVQKGDYLIVHSSLSSFGKVKDGAQAVIDALKMVVGENGIIMMPTFTYGHEEFHHKNTPSKTGLVSEVFRQSEGVLRSLHPAFSVAAWGNDIQGLLEGHDQPAGIGRETPIHKLAKKSSKVLLIGVDHTANSTLHLAQDLANVPYLNRFRDAIVIDDLGKKKIVKIRRAGCSLSFNKFEQLMKNELPKKSVQIGNSDVKLIRSDDILNNAIEFLKEDPACLCCENEKCQSCDEARSMIENERRDNNA